MFFFPVLYTIVCNTIFLVHQTFVSEVEMKRVTNIQEKKKLDDSVWAAHNYKDYISVCWWERDGDSRVSQAGNYEMEKGG